MERLTGSEDVYRRLVGSTEEHWLHGLVSFALIEERRIEWMRHRENHDGAPPDAAEIRRWYEQQTENDLTRAETQAEAALTTYADDILKDILKAETQKAIDRSILGEIERAGHWWRQLKINTVAGVAAALIFALVLVGVTTIVFTDPSPVGIMKALMNERNEEKADGDKAR